MGSLEFGAKQAVVNCLKVKAGERAVIITDRSRAKIASALESQIKLVGGIPHKFIMENFGERPEDGTNPLAFPNEIAQAMTDAQVSIYVASVVKGELMSFREKMLQLVGENGLRHGHMINITEEIMCQGMSADYSAIREISRKVFEVVSAAREIQVTTPAGTDLYAYFALEYKWSKKDGEVRAGVFENLPSGEVYGCPVSADGVVVVDGCLGDFFTEKYGDIQKTPLHYKIEGGRCVREGVECSNAALKAKFEDYTFNTDENSDRLGEFGIGTNIALTGLIGNLLQDEKFPGVHLALGDPTSQLTGVGWSSVAHNDGVMRKPTIVVDGKTIMKDGTFVI